VSPCREVSSSVILWYRQVCVSAPNINIFSPEATNRSLEKGACSFVLGYIIKIHTKFCCVLVGTGNKWMTELHNCYVVPAAVSSFLLLIWIFILSLFFINFVLSFFSLIFLFIILTPHNNHVFAVKVSISSCSYVTMSVRLLRAPFCSAEIF
jgi:presenilin-like A22 family membrane protease